MAWQRLEENPELTDQLECEDTLGHGPLDVIVLRGCEVVASQQVALRADTNRDIQQKHLTAVYLVTLANTRVFVFFLNQTMSLQISGYDSDDDDVDVVRPETKRLHMFAA